MKTISKSAVLIIACILFCSLLKAQDCIWSRQIGSYLFDRALGVSDKFGNVYVGGSFDGEQCHFTDTLLNISGNKGFFLAKYSDTGIEEWVTQFDVSGAQEDAGSGVGDIIVDDNGFVYLTGQFDGSAQFGGISLTAWFGDVFIAKFSPDGDCIWAKKAGGYDIDGGSALAIDSLYNVYVCGAVMDTAQFDGFRVDPGEFLAKYDSSGNCIWVKKIVSFNSLWETAEAEFGCMTIFGGKLLMCAVEKAPSFTLDTTTISHPGLGGHLLCAFTLAGNLLWYREGISLGAYCANNLGIDSIGNIYVTGTFSQSIKFGDSIYYALDDYQDYFVTKYSPNADVLWTRTIRGVLYQTPSLGSIISDKSGYTYVSAGFQDMAYFGNDTVISNTTRDMFLTRFDPQGQCLGVIHFGNAEGREVTIDNEQHPVLVGKFSGDVTIGQNSYTSYGLDDIFIAKYDQISGIEPKSSPLSQLVIYANPNEGKCTITLPEEFQNEKKLTLNIYDSQGKLIQKVPVEILEDRIGINIQAEAKGIYNVILSNGKKNYSGKIIFR